MSFYQLSQGEFCKYKQDFGQRLCNRGYPTALVHKILTEVQFSDRTEALRNKTKKLKEILPFVTTNNTATLNLDLHIFLTSHRLYLTGRKKSLKDVLIRQNFPQSPRNHKKL